MSRGIGTIQNRCLTVLRTSLRAMPTSGIVAAIYPDGAGDSEYVTIRRALRGLVRRNLIVPLNRDYRFGERGWGTPEQAAARAIRESQLRGTAA